MAKRVNRSGASTSSMNFRPPSDVNNSKKGTKPLPPPTPVQQVLLLMVVHLCRKVLYVDPNIKVGIYIVLVFFGSILSDVLPIPHTYFSQKRNVFNMYFVKLSWGWTMFAVGSFVYLTSSVYSVGKNKRHLIRLALATFFWYFITTSFVHIEESYGYCSKTIARGGRQSCLSKGHVWSGFSISGHTFILIYCTLIIMEEAKALICWESIKDHLRNEEHTRSGDKAGEVTPLEGLNPEDLALVKEKYEKYTPYIRVAFIGMTFLALLWDVMLMATIIYFHSTPEKFVASIIAVLIWFLTYRLIFSRRLIGVPLPGEGAFRYMNPVQPLQSNLARRSSFTMNRSEKIPMFMGMPLNPLRAPLTENTPAAKGSAITLEDGTNKR